MVRVAFAGRAGISANVGRDRGRRADDVGEGRALVAPDQPTRGRTEAGEHGVERKQIGRAIGKNARRRQAFFVAGRDMPTHPGSMISEVKSGFAPGSCVSNAFGLDPV